MGKGQTQSGGESAGSANCIFCSIVEGKIPCHRLYEDDQVLAFLDIAPLSIGHSLVIPKMHYSTMDLMPADLVGQCMSVIPRLSRVIMKVTGAPGWNLLQNNGQVAGQEVHHVHYHIIPRSERDGLGYRWVTGVLSPEEAGAFISKINHLLQHG